MKVSVKLHHGKEPICHAFEMILKHGHTPSVTSSLDKNCTKSQDIADVPDTNILDWYKSLLFAELVIDCSSHDILLGSYSESSNKGKPAEPNWTSMDGATSICSQSVFTWIRNTLTTDYETDSASCPILSRPQMNELVRIIHCYILPDIPVTNAERHVLEKAVSAQENLKALADERISRLMDDICDVKSELLAKRWTIVNDILEPNGSQQIKTSHLAGFGSPFLSIFLEHIEADHETACRQLLTHNYERTILETQLAQLPCQQIEKPLATHSPHAVRSGSEHRSMRQIVKDLASAGLMENEDEHRAGHVYYSQWYHNPCKSDKCEYECHILHNALIQLSKAIRDAIDLSLKLVEIRELVLNHNADLGKRKTKSRLNIFKKNKSKAARKQKVFSSNPHEMDYFQKHGRICSLQKDIDAQIWNKSKLEIILHTMRMQLMQVDGHKDTHLSLVMDYPSNDQDHTEWQCLDDQVRDMVKQGSPLYDTMRECVEYTKGQCHVIQALKIKLKELNEKSRVQHEMKNVQMKRMENGVIDAFSNNRSFSNSMSLPLIKPTGPRPGRSLTIEAKAEKPLHVTRLLQTSFGYHHDTNAKEGNAFSRQNLTLTNQFMYSSSSPFKHKAVTKPRHSSLVSFEIFENEGTIECICDTFEPYAEITRVKLKSMLSDHFECMVNFIKGHLHDGRIPRSRIWRSYEKILIPKLMPHLETVYMGCILAEDINAMTEGIAPLLDETMEIEGTGILDLLQSKVDLLIVNGNEPLISEDYLLEKENQSSQNTVSCQNELESLSSPLNKTDARPILRKQSSRRGSERRRAVICETVETASQSHTKSSNSSSIGELNPPGEENTSFDKPSEHDDLFCGASSSLNAITNVAPFEKHQNRQSLFQCVWLTHADMRRLNRMSSSTSGVSEDICGSDGIENIDFEHEDNVEGQSVEGGQKDFNDGRLNLEIDSEERFNAPLTKGRVVECHGTYGSESTVASCMMQGTSIATTDSKGPSEKEPDQCDRINACTSMHFTNTCPIRVSKSSELEESRDDDRVTSSDSEYSHAKLVAHNVIQKASNDKTSKQVVQISKLNRGRFSSVFRELGKIKNDHSLTGKLKGFISSMEELNRIIQDHCRLRGNKCQYGSDDLITVLCVILCHCDVNLLRELYTYLEIVFDFTEGFVSDMGMEFFVLVTYKNTFSYIIQRGRECVEKNKKQQ